MVVGGEEGRKSGRRSSCQARGERGKGGKEEGKRVDVGVDSKKAGGYEKLKMEAL